MNRRSFLKTVTGFIAGILCMPKKAVYSLVFEREGLHTGKKYDPTKIWGKAIAKDWAERSDEIILNCMNA